MNRKQVYIARKVGFEPWEVVHKTASGEYTVHVAIPQEEALKLAEELNEKVRDE